jgi:hypothetical protein
MQFNEKKLIERSAVFVQLVGWNDRMDERDPVLPPRLLRSRRKRPSDRGANESDEFASPHGSRPGAKQRYPITLWMRRPRCAAQQ